ncbi:DUF4241 domain-containing protein [Histomonas meleagridis]|uniref:DUF4241 domain-containing protein n=1 Tax=Histomonas meleagridis TaxID=135588 RepID=UPI0035596394|nr:DUF4241 domain-containing protein [Histomonas meleagridis]KAH0800645.1 DUF4241 domain-containing protein [Histomonas meleagridis]
MNIKELVFIGEFEILSGNIIATDPCFSLKDILKQEFFSGNYMIQNAKKGKWLAYVVYKPYSGWGTICHQLCAIHSSVKDEMASLKWTLKHGLDVESGQAGIFDIQYYEKNEIAAKIEEPLCPDRPWYSVCCDLTLNTPYGAGVLLGGCVSSSGMGDGGYNCYVSTEKGEIQGVDIVFISEEEDDDE